MLGILNIYSYAAWKKHATDPPVNAEWSFKVSAFLSNVAHTHAIIQIRPIQPRTSVWCLWSRLQHQTDSRKKSHASIGHLLQEQKNGVEMTFHLSSCSLFLSQILKMDVINNSAPTIGVYVTDLSSFPLGGPM